VTYIWTQGHKSLGLPIRVTADRAQAHKAFGEMKIREEKRREERIRGKGGKQVNDKMMVIQEDQDGDIWSTI
jgi:hypothetical protein